MHESGVYDFKLVTISILIAIGASYTALNLVTRMRAAPKPHQLAWLAGAAIAMGGGIWSMHFVAMLALRMPGMTIGYDPWLTLLSLCLAILVTAFGFNVASRRSSWPVLIVSGSAVGIGIATMHYTGMAAMRMPAVAHYNAFWVLASVIVAIAAAIMALWLAIHEAGPVQRLMAAVVMGIAVSGMHYVGMYGMQFDMFDMPMTERPSGVHTYLAILVIVITTVILLIASIASVFDRLFVARIEQEAALLRDSERRFRLLIEGVTDYAIFMLDRNGLITNWNAGAERMTGFSAEDMLGSHYSRLYVPEDQAANAGALAQVEAGVRYETEGWRLRKDGSRFLASAVIDALRDDHGELIGFAKIIRDVTERRQAQAALARTQEVLFQSQKMEAVGQLTGGLAHDFNNLLAGVIGSLELLQLRLKQGRHGDVDRYVNAAQESAKRAAALTHRLLAFARRQTLDPRPTNINRLVLGMEDLIRRTIGPQVALQIVLDEDLWSTLLDPPQLESALLNLCLNARDAMPSGGTIMIDTANKWLDEAAARDCDLPVGGYVMLCVSDTGIGMSQDVIAKACDPFFTTKPIGSGTGLGLSMVYGFANQSGGQVAISSKLGMGSTVRLYFPHFQAGAPQSESLHDSRSKLREPSEQSAGETVLVVDDEPNIRDLMADVLEDLGYSVLVAPDGLSGLKILQSDVKLDLLVSDVGLPGGMNGRQMADAARLSRPDLKVLFVTGYAETTVVGNGHLERGMEVMTKPFAIEALATRVKGLIEAKAF